jgi:hypothetical protein
MNRITETTARLQELFSYLVNPVNPVSFLSQTGFVQSRFFPKSVQLVKVVSRSSYHRGVNGEPFGKNQIGSRRTPQEFCFPGKVFISSPHGTSYRNRRCSEAQSAKKQAR